MREKSIPTWVSYRNGLGIRTRCATRLLARHWQCFLKFSRPSAARRLYARHKCYKLYMLYGILRSVYYCEEPARHLCMCVADEVGDKPAAHRRPTPYRPQNFQPLTNLLHLFTTTSISVRYVLRKPGR